MESLPSKSESERSQMKSVNPSLIHSLCMAQMRYCRSALSRCFENTVCGAGFIPWIVCDLNLTFPDPRALADIPETVVLGGA